MSHPTVSCLGLGNMGSAIAECLARAETRLTVWNRDPTRCAPFDGRAAIGLTAGAACAASELIVLSLTNYSVTLEVMDDVAASTNLAGKTLVQLTSGTASDARTMHAWASMHEMHYLDAAIVAYPSSVGSEQALLLVAGDESVWERYRSLFSAVAGLCRYAGESIGAAATLDCAVLEYYYGATLSMLHGAALCDSEGLNLNEYFYLTKSLAPMLAATADEAKSMISREMYAGDQCATNTHIAALRHIQRMAHDNEVEPRVPDTIVNAFKKAVAAGFGNDEIASVFEVLRRDSQ